MKNSITVRRLIAWTWLAALLLTGSASAAYVCPTDMASGKVTTMQQIGCVDDDQPAFCASYLRGSPVNAPQPHPPGAGGPPTRTCELVWRPASVTAQKLSLSLRGEPAPSSVPIYLATARLRP
ncbi:MULTISPECIES: hypothetical protein [Cupriavidus]|uniref:hypothetical protein n=1 Tax=Cupriavidus TaxID=106589 RepID=UPI00129D654E|nr:hypothetical protein [Cupriavidus sp. U2]